MLRKKVFLYVSFVKSVQFVCAIILVVFEGLFCNVFAGLISSGEFLVKMVCCRISAG